MPRNDEVTRYVTDPVTVPRPDPTRPDPNYYWPKAPFIVEVCIGAAALGRDAWMAAVAAIGGLLR